MNQVVRLNTSFTAADLPASDDATSARTHSVLRILDATKSNKDWYNSRGLAAGYHTVTLGGETFRGQRDSGLRLAKIPYDFTGKRVLDVGCSNGGLLHHLADRIAFGVGIDFNAKCVNAANAVKAANGLQNVHFYTFDLDKEKLPLLDSFVFGGPVDICFILNISIWVKRWRETFTHCAGMTETMVFEAHGSEEQQAEQMSFVRSVYADVQQISAQSDDDPTYAKRSMYLCRERLPAATSPGAAAPDASALLAKGDEAAIRAAYAACFPGDVARSLRVFPHTQESIVAEIDGEYIVKFPRASRGAQGIAIEQRITDFVRGRVPVPVPAMSLVDTPVALARYPKLQGEGFNGASYQKLGDAHKDALADQVAAFMLAMHRVTEKEAAAAGLSFSPSWQLSADLIEAQLSTSEHPALRRLVPEVVRNHRNLVVPESNTVFGHFDLHGANLLFDATHRNLVGVIDFGNCKRGDLHQDLSTLCLSSPDLAQRVIAAYERRAKRKVNRLMVQHYATAFYLNLLAGLVRSGAKTKYATWLRQFEGWYDHLLDERARDRLRDAKPLSSIPENWKRWIASSLIGGHDPAAMRKVLRDKGFADQEVALEMANAVDHPFVQAGKEVFLTLRKREWLLRTCDTLHALDGRYSTTVERRTAPEFSVFMREYYSRHLPVVLTGAIDHWRARQHWTPEYLAERCGDAQIEVQTGRDNDSQYERNAGRHKSKVSMARFVEMVTKVGASNDFYMTANNTKASLPGLGPLFDDFGDIADGYRKGQAENGGMYLWFGPRGTFTPLHHDLTNNMLVQVLGRKNVTLIPALEAPYVYSDQSVFSTATDFPDFDPEKHPLLKQARSMEVEIGPGDALFIPVGWWHCVRSLDVSISATFNDFKADNQFSADFPR